MTITPDQCRAARALVGLAQAEIARRASISRNALADFEMGRRMPTADNLAAIRRALEDAGALFIPENGGGVGVRLKFTRSDTKQIARLEGEGGIVGDDDVP